MTSIVLLLALLAGGGRAWETVEGSAWQISAQPPWVAHTGSISVPMTDGSVLLLGGQAGQHGGALFDCFNCTNDVWRFEPTTEQWSNLSADVPWDPRWGHSAVATPDGTVWVIFGCCKKGMPTVMLNDIWTFNPSKGLPWTLVKQRPPFEGVQATSVALLGDDLWVVGGWSQSRGTLSQVAVFSTKTLEWTEKSKHGEAPWHHRADHASVITPDGQWLIIFAGQYRNEKTGHWWRLRDTWRVSLPDARASDWQQLGDLTGARSSVPVIALPSGWLLILGGHHIKDDEALKVKQEDIQGMIEHHRSMAFHTYNDVQALDLRNGGTDGWKTVEPDARWPARDDAAATCLADGSVVIFGGGTLYGGGGYLRDVWRLPDPVKAYGLDEPKPSSSAGDEL